MTEIFRAISHLIDSGCSGALAIVIEARGSAPQIVGAKMVVQEGKVIAGTIGGGAIEYRVLQTIPTVIAQGKARVFHYELEQDVGMKCGGSMAVYIEPISKRYRTIIFGAGHIGTILSKFVKQLDFEVLVVDNRPEYANPEKLPDADEIWVEPYENAVKRLDITERDFIVILTHGHLHDFVVLENLLGKPYAYIGMIGSRKKVAAAFEALKEKGFSQESIDQVHSPIGIKIGGDSPAEIAVSICAELVQVRHSLNR